MPVMPMSNWPSETAGIMASQLAFSYTGSKFSRSASSATASYSQPTASPLFGSTNCRGRVRVLGDHDDLAALEIRQIRGEHRTGRGQAEGERAGERVPPTTRGTTSGWGRGGRHRRDRLGR